MTYQRYIDLGFKRIDMVDEVEFRESGYYGYILIKSLNDNMSIEVYSSELNVPKLYIKKKNYESKYHIIDITFQMVEDLF
jgi:hypothetical protein